MRELGAVDTAQKKIPPLDNTNHSPSNLGIVCLDLIYMLKAWWWALTDRGFHLNYAHLSSSKPYEVRLQMCFESF